MVSLSVISQEDIEAIHQATLRILDDVGLIMTHPLAREILCGAGARIVGGRVMLPPELVCSVIKTCPKRVSFRGRTGHSVTLGDGGLHWHNLGGARDVYNPETGRKRPAEIQDVIRSTRLLDALENVTTVTPFFTPQDVPGEIMSLAMYRYTIPHTIKPLHGPGVQTADEVNCAVQMAEVVGPPQDLLTLSVSPLSPLTFPEHLVGAILAIAGQGIIFSPLPCPTAGTTAPMSLAGALAQQNAEVLASLVLACLARPGLPVIYCGRLAMMEPRTGLSVWGGVELGMASAATVQIAHTYGMPVNVYGFSTNSHTLDIQNGYERAWNALLPALAGADELSGIGELEAGVMGSYAQIVCDDEIAGSLRRLRSGFSCNEDALAVPEIAVTMAGSRNFLGRNHTRRYLRAGELFLTHLADRNSWEAWEADDRRDMTIRAEQKANELLSTHDIPGLEDGQEIELERILRSALNGAG
jgi:trimethylamine--corrinoid protein Co-methyltransferase